MQAWAERLSAFAAVTAFDYPYMKAGRRAPDRLAKLVAAHHEALQGLRERSSGPIALAGKSMGARVGCHLALEETVDRIVCFGYPLKALGKSGKVRDEVLLALSSPVLFVQGDRDPMCPLGLLEEVRARMSVDSELHVVEGGDHSLLVGKRRLAAAGQTQEDCDELVLAAVRTFLGG